MSDDDPSKTETTPKYQQIVVPDHAIKPNTSGTSFLRTGTFPSLTDATKQPPGFRESLALARQAGEQHLKTGGSWHHVDGNRIETTTGRKVEVIKGSYVAHRGPGNSPGPNFSSTWATNSYTQIGSKDVPIGWDPNVSPAAAPARAPTDPAANFVETLSFTYDGSIMGDDAQSRVETNPPNPDNSNNSLQLGDVAAVTWGQRIMTYVGSTNRPVPLVYAETWAQSMHSYSYYSVESKTFVGSDSNPVPTLVARTDAGSIESKSYAHTGDITTWNHALDTGSVWQDTVGLAILTTQEAKVDISVFNTAPILTTVNTGAVQATLNVGAGIGTLNLALGIAAINIGANVQINMPAKWTFSGDEGGVKLASTDITNLATSLRTTTWNVWALTTYIAGEYEALTPMRTELSGVWTALGTMFSLGP